MTQPQGAQQNQPPAVPSRWERVLAGGAAILNALLDGSSGRPASTPEAARQRRPGGRASVWYGALLSLGFVLLNGGYLLLASVLLHSWASRLSRGGPSSTDQLLLPLQGLLLFGLFLVFFIACLLLGRAIRAVWSGVLLSCYACMIGGTLWIVGVQPWEGRALFGDEVGLQLLVYGALAPWLWGIAQVLASVGGASLGGLIGSHFFPKRPS